MKSRFIVAAAFAIVLAAGSPSLAHHGVSAYDVLNPITIKGTVTEFVLQNPHSMLFLDVKDKDGKVVNWAIEAGGPTALLRRGLRKTDFPAGVEVTVKGYRAKSGAPKANGQSVTLKDGRNFFLGAGDAASAPTQ